MTTPIPTFCRVCEPSCGLRAEVVDGRVERLLPDASHPVSAGFACQKGMNYVGIHRDPDRLDTPLRRAPDGSFEATTWDAAIADIAGTLARIRDEHGSDAIAGYIGNPTAFNALASQAITEFFGGLGTRSVFSSGTQDCSNKFAGAEAVFGTSTLHPLPDIARTDCLLVFGENPRVSHMSFISIADPMAKLRAACERGARVVYINPRHIESASPTSGEVLQILPDTDLYLMAALLHEIDAQGGFREGVIAAHGKHIEGLRAFIAPYSAAAVADVVGVPAETIRELAHAFSSAERAAVHMSTGVNMGRQGTLCYWLLQMLSFVTGNLDAPGGNFYGEGFYPAAKAGRVQQEQPFFDSPFGELRHVRGALPGNLFPDMVLDAERPLRALIVLAGNPVLSAGGEPRWREALSQLELLVVIDLVRNATGEHAHYLLPSTDMLERADINICGLGMQYEPYVQYTPAVVPPAGERREEWWILARLQHAMGMPSLLDAEPPAPFARLDRMLARSGLSIAELAARPDGVAVLPPPAQGRFYTELVQTPDRRVDCCPPLFAEALSQARAIFDELRAAPPRFRLINLRTPFMQNSWYHNIPKLKRGRHAHNPLHLSPEDMAALGLAEGDPVHVESAHGRLLASAHGDRSLRPGVVAMTHGWGNAGSTGLRVARAHPGVNVNALLPTGPGSYEKLSNQAFMTGVPVSVSAAN
ncbi:MAG: molybdopterin-dependent oxidoreductase [Sandaracinaceae bacterium]|nr:molybdopterin-dependent oxidoreductase [Sandaracinaceae bacterium]